MKVALQNYLKGIDTNELVANVKDRSKFEEILVHLGLNQNSSIDQFVEHLLFESKMLLNQEKRKEATIVLRAIEWQ